ncbi:MAG TPA: PQQ-dependent sugar dehydrogenase [Solirubrobacterales bacterium]
MPRIVRIALPLAATVALLSQVAPSQAATLVPIGSFDRPMFVTSDPTDPDRLFVVEREGRVLVATATGFELFGELEALVSCCTSERGLLSIALAPDFSTTERFYAAYTGETAAGGAEGDIHLDAFRPSPAGGGALLREPILTIGHADEANHNGGQLQFGPDGHLFLSTGDGGGVGDPDGNGQDLESLLGKLLRIEPQPGSVPSYTAPVGNPFVDAPGRDEIWSYGLRNPWRFSFDRGSGDLVIADVGQSLREEVDHAPSPAPGLTGGIGANFGWNCREGLIAYPAAPASCTGFGFTDPAFEYPHDDPGGDAAHGCSITGGYVVRDPGLGDLYGRYLYADFCIGELRSLLLPAVVEGSASGDRSEGLAVANPVSFGEDACGRIYVVSNSGGVFRLYGDSGPACAQAPPRPVFPGGPTTVSAAPPATSRGSSAAARLHRLTLRVRRLDRGVELIVRVLPCDGAAGLPVQLNRGGRSIGRKRLDERCSARFRLRFAGRATFRAVFEGQRSQVRTIALAKPRP